MFCPRCATENHAEQRFCRRCGLAMPAVRLALEAHMDEALPLMRRGQAVLEWSTLALFIGLLNGFINAYIGAWSSAAFSVVVALLISLVLLVVGKKKIRRANRLMQPSPQQSAPAALDDGAAHSAASVLPEASEQDAPQAVPPQSASVADDTTLKLRTTKRPR